MNHPVNPSSNPSSNISSDDGMPDEFEPTAHELLVGELTAAMLEDQRSDDDTDRLPPELAARLTATGQALLRARTVPPIVATDGKARRRGVAWGSWGGWLAAAAMLVLFVRAQSDAPRAVTPVGTPVVAAISPAVALRDSLEAASTTDQPLLRREWTATTDSTASAATGEVIWDSRTQRGVMRFAGLAPNDKARWQYQLWIFDKARDERYPVDGGVFDISADGGEVFIPIRARLAVGEPVLFAVTVEKAGGVVVSNRQRIAVLAKL